MTRWAATPAEPLSPDLGIVSDKEWPEIHVWTNPLTLMHGFISFLFVFLFTVISVAQKKAERSGAEPDAGKWRTIMLASPTSVDVPPPPGKEASRRELREIVAVQAMHDSSVSAAIQYWNAGPPALRWQRIADNLYDSGQYWVRVYAYMNAAIYDATVSAWHAKYRYQRVRPVEISRDVRERIPSPYSPSYPCEHAVTAGAAATVLGYLFPAKKDSLMDLARKAGQSRIAAGVQYPSDVAAGLELGAKVGELVIAKAKSDGFDKVWGGSVPKGREYYTGRPMRKDLANMKTWLLTSSSQFRSPPPPGFDSDIEELRNYQPDPYAKYKAFRWEFSWPWGDVLDQKMLEYNLNNNPLRAAFVYALVSLSDYDCQIAHWDSKYTYFRARPDQYDTAFHALFPTPPSPSYPAGHGTIAYTRAKVLSYLFPYDRDLFFSMAEEANESRFQAGVHYRSDNEAGKILGEKIGDVAIEKGRQLIGIDRNH